MPTPEFLQEGLMAALDWGVEADVCATQSSFDLILPGTLQCKSHFWVVLSLETRELGTCQSLAKRKLNSQTLQSAALLGRVFW